MIQEPKKEDNKEKDEKTPNDENGVMMSGHIKICLLYTSPSPRDRG